MAIQGWTGTLLPLLSLEAAVGLEKSRQPDMVKSLKKGKKQTYLLHKLSTALLSFT